MDGNLEHEDLLIKLRAKLNEEKIKLWEPPYLIPEQEISEGLQSLATKYAADLSVDNDTLVKALRELQLHSVDRSKANEHFKETGCATLRVRATVPGEKARVLKVEKRLDVTGTDLIEHVATEINVDTQRIKLIHNGKLLKPTPSLEEQGVQNGAQIMALVMAETAEQSVQDERLYRELRATRDDAALLADYQDELGDDDYVKLEDQSGAAVSLPAAERRALVVGLALHARARAALAAGDPALALVLLLDADDTLSACRSSLLQAADNWAVLQLDVAWCYLRLRAAAAADAARRLRAAEAALARSYGERGQRLTALKGSVANERVLFMRLYLLQGVAAFHQNRREEARALLRRARAELDALRVDESSVAALVELGWSAAQARGGLRAAGGDRDAAHLLLTRRTSQRDQRRAAGQFPGVDVARLLQLQGAGAGARAAARALLRHGNSLEDAAAALQQHPELYADSESSDSDSASAASAASLQPDDKLVTELCALGYCAADARAALALADRDLQRAAQLLVDGTLHDESQDASTSSAAPSAPSAPSAPKRHKRDSKKKLREQALKRLKSVLSRDEEDYLDSSLTEEEMYIAQYSRLLQ